LKRRNYSPHTIKNYLHVAQHFLMWINVPVEEVGKAQVAGYIEQQLARKIAAKTINCQLVGIRQFYRYLREEEGLEITAPVPRGYSLRLPKPLPKYLHDEAVDRFLKAISKKRDFAIFKLMLRCGLRVQEVANLTLDVIDYRHSKILIVAGKGGKDRMVYFSNDTADALADYLDIRPATKERRIFLVEKGSCKGQPISVRGIQKRIEYYSRTSRVPVSCHQLRHTMATQLLNADADLVTLQDLLGHTMIKTTQIYAKVSNRKVQRDYHKAMYIILSGQHVRTKDLT
jgi:site-specific recombinase XerD